MAPSFARRRLNEFAPPGQVKRYASIELLMSDQPPVKRKRKEFYQHVIQQLTVVSSLLGGFSFAGLTVLLTITQSQFFSSTTFLLTALTTCLLVGASIIGALFSVFYFTEDERTPAVFVIWFFLVPIGIVLFFATLVMLAFSLKFWVGIVCAGVSLLVVVLIFWAWATSASASDKLGETES